MTRLPAPQSPSTRPAHAGRPLIWHIELSKSDASDFKLPATGRLRTAGWVIPSFALFAAISGLPAAAAAKEFCLDCLSIRVEAPMIVRGPLPNELDTPLQVQLLPDGGYRAFSSNAAVYAIDSASLDDLNGARRTVLSPGPAGSDADCGNWLNGLAAGKDGALYGLIHRERSCDYDKGETHKSMALATSANGGLSWTQAGTIVSGEDAPTAGKGTGIGDCSWVDGHDGWRYAYCLRLSDWKTIAARASADDLAPGQWRNYFEGGWNEDALGGKAASLGFVGTAAGYFGTLDRVGLLVADKWFGGVRLAFSSDKVSFDNFPEPLIPLDGEEWSRPAPSELIAYPALIDPITGGNDLGADFFLSYTWLAPGATFADRYLVLQKVRLTETTSLPDVQAGIALTRWRGDGEAIWSTTGPVIPVTGLRQDRRLGYLLTKAPEKAASLKLEECTNAEGGRLVADGACARLGEQRLRTAGFVFAEAREHTVPLYRCAAGNMDFASNDAACEGRGSVIERLGFALRWTP